MFCKHEKQKSFCSPKTPSQCPTYKSSDSKFKMKLSTGETDFSLRAQRKIQDYMKDMRLVISDVDLQRTIETERIDVMGKLIGENVFRG